MTIPDPVAWLIGNDLHFAYTVRKLYTKEFNAVFTIHPPGGGPHMVMFKSGFCDFLKMNSDRTPEYMAEYAWNSFGDAVSEAEKYYISDIQDSNQQ